MSDLTPAKIAEIFECGEAEAYVNYFLCAPPEFARPFRLNVRRLGSAWMTMLPTVDSVNHNRVLALGVGEPVTEAILDEMIAVFQDAGCENYTAQISALVEPTQYGSWLNARGFTQGRNWAKMYRGDEPAPSVSSDLRVEPIGKELAEAYSSIVLSVFGISAAYRPLVDGNIGKPGWHHYIAFGGEQPVSAAGMYVNGEVAWLSFASTLTTHRKHGGQSAMLARRIEDGLTLGCKWFIAETKEDAPDRPNPSYHNMLRNGFKLAYLQRYYYHQRPMNFAKKIRRTIFLIMHGLKVEWQRFLQ